jgi:hypothetical protein
LHVCLGIVMVTEESVYSIDTSWFRRQLNVPADTSER